MATINASTTLKVKVATKKVPPSSASSSSLASSSGRIGAGGNKKKAAAGAAAASQQKRKGSVAPPLKGSNNNTIVNELRLLAGGKEELKNRIIDLQRKAFGEQLFLDHKSAPHSASSTTRDRGMAAADIALAAKEFSVPFVLLECGILDQMQRMLFPDGCVQTLLTKNGALEDNNEMDDNNNNNNNTTPFANNTLKPSASALSLASMDNGVDGGGIGASSDSVNDNTTVTSITSLGTQKDGKKTPANGREGSLLIIRALCEIVGKPHAEPYVVGAFLAASLEECGSSSSAVRQAAEDTTTAIIRLANPYIFPTVVCPLLIQSIKSPEWRVKFNALEKLQQCANSDNAQLKAQVYRLLPRLIPIITSQVWDTKPQVSKASGITLLAICKTCTNPDVIKSIPAVVNAICKPSETTKAVDELMGTTFVVPVDAPTLSILCPVLARALKEKLAIHKRSACIVISNMSKLVVTPSAVAPFGSLLLPELQKVVTNVQFSEIRDEALKALSNLTKALGDSYKQLEEQQEQRKQKQLQLQQQQQERQQQQQQPPSLVGEVDALHNDIELERSRIQKEKEEAELKEKILLEKEKEERRKFKEAMEAQRQLDLIAEKEQQRKKEEEMLKKEKAKLDVKTQGGKCQSCGLKKCRKTCMFFTK